MAITSTRRRSAAKTTALVVFLALLPFAAVYSYLLLNPGYFRDRIWTKWSCKYGTAENHGDDVAKIAFIPASEPRTVYCPAPFPYEAKTNRFNLRSVPPDPERLEQVELLLFGDSFSWGTGLTEKQSMAFHIARKTGLRTLSFARPGENAAGILMSITKLRESGQLKELANVRAVVYTFRDTHLARSAGRGRWSFHNSPKYVVENGRPVFQGYFSDLSHLDQYVGLEKLNMFWHFLKIGTRGEAPQDEDVDLTVALITEMRAVLTSETKAVFHLNIWPEQGAAIERRRQLLRDRLPPDLNVHMVTDEIKSFEHNAHPNPEGAEKMADFLSAVVRPKR